MTHLLPPESEPSTYAWIIDKDHLGPIGETSDRKGTQGPSNAPQELLDELRAGQGVRWRCLDDDNEVYYSGRIVFAGPPSYAEFEVVEHEGYRLPLVKCLWNDEEGFGPLNDFCGPDAGAVEIQYWVKDQKVWAVL